MSWIVFELIIWAFLLSVGAFLLIEAKRKTRSKQRRGVWWLLLAAWVTIFWGSFVEPRLLMVREETVAVSSAPQRTLRAAVVSDIHAGPYKGKGWVSEVVEAVNAEHPDVVFLVGDSISNSPADALALEPLRGLVAPMGVYAVTGNHDYEDGAAEYVAATLETLGVRMLRDSSVRIADGKIVLVGVNDLWNGGNIYRAVSGLRAEDTIILLAHNPDAVLDPETAVVDLVVAGHTHGGQIRLPFWGSVPHIPTDLGNTYDKGLFVYNGEQLYITAGVSETGTRARLFNPPEISVLNIEY